MGLLSRCERLDRRNYLTTTGRGADEDRALLDVGMPVADGPGEGRFVVDADGAHPRPACPRSRYTPSRSRPSGGTAVSAGQGRR